MTKLETVDRVRDAIEAAPATTMRKNLSRRDGRPWEVVSIRQDGNDWPVQVHSDHVTEADAYAAWQRLERQKITRAVVETMREPTFDMVFAGVERLKAFGGAIVPGPVLEESWTAMIDVLLAELPKV